MAAHSLSAVLIRVQKILERACEQDGQDWNLQESQRRKAYRAGINEALSEIRDVKLPKRRD